MHWAFRVGRGPLLAGICLVSFISLLYCMSQHLDRGGGLLRLQHSSFPDILFQEALSAETRESVVNKENPERRKMRLGSSLLPLASMAFASPWTWTCEPATSFCSRQLLTEGASRQTEAQCRLSCAPATLLWPSPTSATFGNGGSMAFDPTNFITEVQGTAQIEQMLMNTVARHTAFLASQGTAADPAMRVVVRVSVQGDSLELPTESEAYTLGIIIEDGSLVVNVVADTYFGARHGVETLFQLAVWDPDSSSFLLPTEVQIEDSPHFPHRGVMLDTARNFIPIPDILKLIDSMSYSKQNVFHWHLTDSQSFPLVMPSLPDFVRYGAYRPDQVYMPEQVKELVEYARERGVQVVPELDAPAHVGAGWQAVNEKLTVCVNREPWTEWCVEPPCGQLNPAMDELYDVLENIYRDWLEMFKPTTFHVGGDEVHLGCWNSTQSILAWLQDEGKGDKEEDFMYLWHHFLTRSDLSMKSAARSLEQGSPQMTIWSNQLTHPDHIHFMDKDKYVIQLWTDASNPSDVTIKTVAEKGFKMIFSNHDATYLDCGFGAWVGNGHNWCSPYKQWQAQHGNDPYAILELQNVSNLDVAKANVLGGEVALWTEQADAASMMSKIEPRASAYAERLWRGPLTGNWVEAERRLVIHRERIAGRGIMADTLTHGWCRQNEGKCILEDGMGETAPIF